MPILNRHVAIAHLAVITAIPASTGSVQLVPTSENRKGLQIYNNSAARMYCTWGAPASITGASFVLLGSGVYELPPNYQKIGISGIWDSAVGSGIITEFI